MSDVPEAQWAALVKSNGILVGMYPSSAGLSAERISAMSVAAEILGEQITKELKHGTFQHALLAGSNGANLVIALNNDYCLSVSLRTAASLHQAFETLHPSLSALQDLLGRLASERENREKFL